MHCPLLLSAELLWTSTGSDEIDPAWTLGRASASTAITIIVERFEVTRIDDDDDDEHRLGSGSSPHPCLDSPSARSNDSGTGRHAQSLHVQHLSGF